MPSFDQWDTVWRIAPDGTATEFARPVVSGPHVLALGFGPNRAMYVSEALPTYEVITIYRIVPEQDTFILLSWRHGAVKKSLRAF